MNYSILFLEDEADLGLPLLDILKREGYQVDYYQSGEEAVKAGQSKQYDLLLLDIMLKNFNVPVYNEITSGMEVARLINQERQTPFIFLSGRSDTYDMVTGLEMGAAHYIPKPYDLSLLLATLRAFFREQKRILLPKKTHSETEIIFGDIRIDLINRVTYLNGEKVIIQEKPFSILVYLAKNRGRLVPKEELLQEIWGYSYSKGFPTNTVEVNIRRLRTAIGEQYVGTARGEGYFLQEQKGKVF